MMSMTEMKKAIGKATVPPARVLIRDGDWTIEELVWMKDPPSFRGARRSRSRFVSLIKHVCFPDGQVTQTDSKLAVTRSVHQVVVYADDSSHCWRCNAPIPDGMQVLWKFQNWKELEHGR